MVVESTNAGLAHCLDQMVKIAERVFEDVKPLVTKISRIQRDYPDVPHELIADLWVEVAQLQQRLVQQVHDLLDRFRDRFLKIGNEAVSAYMALGRAAEEFIVVKAQEVTSTSFERVASIITEEGWRYPGHDIVKGGIPCANQEEAVRLFQQHPEAAFCTYNGNTGRAFLKRQSAEAGRTQGKGFVSFTRRGR